MNNSLDARLLLASTINPKVIIEIPMQINTISDIITVNSHTVLCSPSVHVFDAAVNQEHAQPNVGLLLGRPSRRCVIDTALAAEQLRACQSLACLLDFELIIVYWTVIDLTRGSCRLWSHGSPYRSKVTKKSSCELLSHTVCQRT